MPVRLSEAADADITRIFVSGGLEFGVDQAIRYHEGLEDVFDRLARFPEAMRERHDISPPVRVYAYKAHVILYEVHGDDVLILRIRSAREDWQSGPL